MPTRPDDPPADASPPYRLPGPLSHRGELPVAAGAPRIPRALRAFNGMGPPPEEPLQPASVRGGPQHGRDGLTIRDLLEEPSEEPPEEGKLASLRAALGRLRRAAGGRPGD